MGLTIAYACNIRPKDKEGNERYGEWESEETIEAVVKALEKTGNKIILLDADKDIYFKLHAHRKEIDLVFNNAEGFQEFAIREARVPFFCEELDLPYSGSGPETLTDSMNKTKTKEILRNYGIKTPNFQEMRHYTDRLERDLKFPLMVKPAAEGTSIGITQDSRVKNLKQLEAQVRKIVKDYNQPALIEEFMDGNEYTVGIIGKFIFPILEVKFNKIPGRPKIRDPHVKDIETPHMNLMTVNTNEKGEFDVGKNPKYIDLVTQTAIAFDALECNDYCRMDFREHKGKVYFLEMNPLPGIHPVEGDLSHMVQHAGLNFPEMMNMIIFEAVKRNLKDLRYKERFPEKKIEDIVNYVKLARQKFKFYNIEREDDYRLVRVTSLDR